MGRIKPGDKHDDLTRFAFATGTALALLVLFHIVQRIFSRGHTVSKDARGSNVAYLLLQAGHVLAVLLLVPGIVREALTHETLDESALWAGAFVGIGVPLIQIVGSLGVLLLLRAGLKAELERGNVAAGVAGGANYVAIGILGQPAIAGADLGDLGLSIAFFSLSVVTLAVAVVLFRALTAYDDAEQIKGENLPAAISYAGVTIAVAMILARALKGGGPFPGWGPALKGFASVAVLAFALYPVRQIVVQGLILGRMPTLRGGALDDAIGTERNAGMAVVEALAYIATAVAIASLLPEAAQATSH